MTGKRVSVGLPKHFL